MQARYHDGRTAAAHEVTLEVTRDQVSFRHDGALQVWPVAGLEVEPLSGRVRLGRPGDPARLIVSAREWRASPAGLRTASRGRRRAILLVSALTVGGAAAAAAIFIGVPLASGPLARATPPEFEAGMGDNFVAQFQVTFPRCEGEPGQRALQGLADRLEARSDTIFPIRIRAVEAPMANAFALPGGHILVTDDLIAMAKTPDELAAVIAHETAHVELRHVMQAVWRALGLGLVLDTFLGGGTGAGQQAVLLASSFNDLRYSRTAEREADARGQQILVAAGLSSAGMAPFFERLAKEEGGSNEDAVRELISSHPDSLARARESRAREMPGASALTAAEWAAVRAACKSKPKRRLFPGRG